VSALKLSDRTDRLCPFAQPLKATFSERVGECAEEAVMLGALSQGVTYTEVLDELRAEGRRDRLSARSSRRARST
jgi:hypothetical protein